MPIKGLNSSVSSLQIFLANGYTLYYKNTVLYSQGQARELRFTLKSEAAIPTSSLSFIQDLNAHLQLSTTSLNWQLFFLLQLCALHIVQPLAGWQPPNMNQSSHCSLESRVLIPAAKKNRKLSGLVSSTHNNTPKLFIREEEKPKNQLFKTTTIPRPLQYSLRMD